MAGSQKLVLAVVGAALLVPAPANAAQGTDCVGATTPVKEAGPAAAERSFLCLLNVYRADSGRGILTHDTALNVAAHTHSVHMETTAQFAHQDIGDGTPQSRATAAGYPFGVGENIAYSTAPGVTPTDIIEIFKASPAHNANMLDPTAAGGGGRIVYATAGMGFAVGANFGVTATQVFGVTANGAADTAADLLTSPACDAARAAIDPAEKAVAKAKRKLKNADTSDERKRAKKKLRKAKKALADVGAEEAELCALTY